MLKAEIKKIVRETVALVYPNAAIPEFNIDEPPADVGADLSSNAAFPLAKLLGESPAKIAEALAARLPAGPVIKKAEVARNGFLNLSLDDSYLKRCVAQALSENEDFGKSPDARPGKVMIEFVSANPTGPLHIGHARGASLGDSLVRIYRKRGYAVTAEYYINDIGIQMQTLAESVRLRAKELAGETVQFPDNGYKGGYIRDIAKTMAEQKRDDFPDYPRQAILDMIRADLEQFGVHFDSWFSEASLHRDGKVEKALDSLRAKNALKEKDGALWFVQQGAEDEDKELDKDRVLKKSDGRYTYFASDVAYHKDKFDRGFTRCIDIWGHDHHGYVPRVEASLNLIGAPKGGLKILLYQLVSLKRGGKRVVMSTRAGEFITLKEILDEVGRDACRFFFAMRSPSSQLEFDVDLAKKQTNENPVFYVQYLHARICSIFREAEKRGIVWDGKAPADEVVLEKEERDLMKKLGFFGDMLESSIQIDSPHLLTEFLIDCATKFHKFYDKCRVLDAEPAVCRSRLALLRSLQIMVKSGLGLLGVSAPERM